jgi:hypothetical protein
MSHLNVIMTVIVIEAADVTLVSFDRDL